MTPLPEDRPDVREVGDVIVEVFEQMPGINRAIWLMSYVAMRLMFSTVHYQGDLFAPLIALDAIGEANRKSFRELTGVAA